MFMASKLASRRTGTHSTVRRIFHHPPRQRLSSASSASPPTPPPRDARTALPSRAFLAVSGADAPRFLQGLVTTNITASIPDRPLTLYTAFLNAQGRILNDVFLYAFPKESPLLSAIDAGASAFQNTGDAPVYLIEADASEASSLAARLTKHKLRSRVTIRKIPEDALEVYAGWSPALQEALKDPEPVSTPFVLAADPRHHSLGMRALLPSSQPPSATDLSDRFLALPVTDSRHYTIRRYERGIAEGPAELARGSVLPHAANLELLGAIDLRKGCYVGQELVTRTQHRGVVRRRIVACQLPSADGMLSTNPAYKGEQDWQVPNGTEMEVEKAKHRESEGDATAGRRRRARNDGRWIAGIGEVGLAEVNLESMVRNTPTDDREPMEEASGVYRLRLEGGEDGPLVRGFWLEWLNKRMQSMISQQAPQGVQT